MFKKNILVLLTLSLFLCVFSLSSVLAAPQYSFNIIESHITYEPITAVGSNTDATKTITILVTREGYTSCSVSVPYWTEEGTAEEDSDYESISGTLEFPSGVTEQYIEITIYGNSPVEQDEYFYLKLHEYYVLENWGCNDTCIITIKDPLNQSTVDDPTDNNES